MPKFQYIFEMSTATQIDICAKQNFMCAAQNIQQLDLMTDGMKGATEKTSHLELPLTFTEGFL